MIQLSQLVLYLNGVDDHPKKCGFMGTKKTLFTALLCLAYVVSESPSLAMHSSGLRMFALWFLLLAVQRLGLAQVLHTQGVSGYLVDSEELGERISYPLLSLLQ